MREGEKLDTSALISPTEEEIAQVKAVTGLTFHIEIRRREANGARPAIRAPILIEERTLTPETLIETEEGEIGVVRTNAFAARRRFAIVVAGMASSAFMRMARPSSSITERG